MEKLSAAKIQAAITEVSALKLSEQDLLHVARLASLSLSPAELTGLGADLEKILDYVTQLSEISTEGVPPTSHVHGSVNVFRDDVIKQSLPLEDLEKNAPDFSHGGFRIPRVL